MLSLVLASLRRSSHLGTPSLRAAAANASRLPIASIPNNRFFSGGEPFAVDAPDGDHDLQDIVSFCSLMKKIV
jgi:hypothetical protein